MADEQPATSFQVIVARRVEHMPWWSGTNKRLEAIVAALPAHRDTRSGRRNAAQVRGVMLTAGILTVVLWQSPWAPTALLLCVAALFLPMREARRRMLCASLRARRIRHTRVDRAAGTLVVDETHVTVESDGAKVRRLRRKTLSLEETAAGLLVRGGPKKVDQLLLVSDGEPERTLWVELTDPRAVESQLRA